MFQMSGRLTRTPPKHTHTHPHPTLKNKKQHKNHICQYCNFPANLTEVHHHVQLELQFCSDLFTCLLQFKCKDQMQVLLFSSIINLEREASSRLLQCWDTVRHQLHMNTTLLQSEALLLPTDGWEIWQDIRGGQSVCWPYGFVLEISPNQDSSCS